MILALVYLIAHYIIVVRNQGGNIKAIFWVILAVFSFVENYLIFVPVMCILKAIMLIKHGNYHPRVFRCEIRNIISIILITDVDRAIWKELVECVKNNQNSNEEKMMTSEVMSSQGSEDINISSNNDNDTLNNKAHNHGKSISKKETYINKNTIIENENKERKNVDVSQNANSKSRASPFIQYIKKLIEQRNILNVPNEIEERFKSSESRKRNNDEIDSSIDDFDN